MHLSELYQVTSSLKPDSANNTQPKMKMNIPKFSDLSSSFLPNDDDGFVELLWENGQVVVMHGQSNRPNKNYNANTNTNFSLFPKIPSFGSVDPLIEHDEESVPWINCPIDDSLCSELLSDHFENPSPNKPVLKRAVPVINLKNTELIAQQQDMPPFPNKENNGSTSGTLNFSHFTRPVAKAGLHNDQERLNNEKASTSYNNNPLESTLIQSSGDYETISIPSSLPTMIEQPTYKKQVLASNKPEKLEKLKEKSKGGGPVVASSSVCSGNVELKHGLKRKSLEKEDSCLRDSEDIDESVELKRRNSSKAAGIKRSRTAEVHNLSERRRRDRINEKMRALQELIPNCNKVDKASMLDEAIEYLKSLQLQVQMMASGAGFCMPHMMFPPGIHPMRLPIPVHMPPPFHHIGMGMGYGMGIPDLNGYPSVPPQIMHGGRNVLNTALPMFGFPSPVVVASNKENVGESSSHIESASQRENAQVESG